MRIARDHRPVVGRDHLDIDSRSTANRDALVTDIAVAPFVPEQVAGRVVGLECLDIYIVDIDKGVSDAKCDMTVVGKMWERRHARHRKPDGIERVAGEVKL